jgi:hypothetical protein
MPRRADAQVYISLIADGVVSEYDEVTGQLINANFITGLSGPNELVLSGDILFVANQDGSAGKYDARTGAATTQSFITGTNFEPVGLALSGANFITGLGYPYQLAVLGDKLFVTDGGAPAVGEYDARTGAVINATFISGFWFYHLVGIAAKAQSK